MGLAMGFPGSQCDNGRIMPARVGRLGNVGYLHPAMVPKVPSPTRELIICGIMHLTSYQHDVHSTLRSSRQQDLPLSVTQLSLDS
jgi:hypothetical protein